MPGEPTRFPKSPFTVYGAGNCGRDVFRVLKENDYEVIAFIDINAESIGTVDGVPCFAPESVEALQYAALPIILAVFSNAIDTGAIEAMLQKNGFSVIIPYYVFFENFPEQVRSRYWLTPRFVYQSKEAELTDVLGLLCDETSRNVFLETLKLRLTFDVKLLRDPDLADQYFPKDLPAPKYPMRFVDGGSYVGDTIKAMIARGFDVEAAACFEPEPLNFSRLSEFARYHLAPVRELCLFPCGLGESTKTHRFFAGHDAASSISEYGDSVIQVVALDEVLPNFTPTFIKLDVEGAERASLLGARKTIEQFRPAIAVCLYHKAEDLWELPLLLSRLTSNYEFALRYHGFNGFELVFYAIPR